VARFTVHATWMWLKKWTPIYRAVRFAKQTSISAIMVICAVTSHEKGKKHEIAVRNADPTSKTGHKRRLVGYRHLSYLHLVPLPRNRLLTTLKIAVANADLGACSYYEPCLIVHCDRNTIRCECYTWRCRERSAYIISS
jgi:hypothetical protein